MSTSWDADYYPIESKPNAPRGTGVLLGPTIILVLALIGMADAFYDSYAIYAGQELWCPPPIDGCNIVANSPYACAAGVPLGYFGFVYYLYAFGLGALLAFDPLSRGLRWGAILYGAVGVCFSAYFMYVQRTYIHAFCIYCLISGVLTVLLLVTAVWHHRTAPQVRTKAASVRPADPPVIAARWSQ